jgi:hypothetical protein
MMSDGSWPRLSCSGKQRPNRASQSAAEAPKRTGRPIHRSHQGQSRLRQVAPRHRKVGRRGVRHDQVSGCRRPAFAGLDLYPPFRALAGDNVRRVCIRSLVRFRSMASFTVRTGLSCARRPRRQSTRRRRRKRRSMSLRASGPAAAAVMKVSQFERLRTPASAQAVPVDRGAGSNGRAARWRPPAFHKPSTSWSRTAPNWVKFGRRHPIEWFGQLPPLWVKPQVDGCFFGDLRNPSMLEMSAL